MNINQPLVSVIILTYNSQAYVGRALDSIRKQTYSNIEVVVVDNGSTDDTQKTVEAFGGTTWLPLPNSDMGMARNYGVKNSRGDYIMFLDSDDFYLAHKVESQVAALSAKPELEVVFSLAYIYRAGKSDLIGIKSNTIKKLSFHDFLSGYCYTLATICIRRSTWDKGLAFSEGEQGRYGEDWRFQLGLVSKEVIFDVLLDTPSVVVEVREGSHTAWEIQPKMKALGLATVEDILKSGIDKKKLDVATTNEILDNYRFKLAVSLLLVGRRNEARVTLSELYSRRKSFSACTLYMLTAVFPRAWMRKLLEVGWLKRQDNTFQWSRPPNNISEQIAGFSSQLINTNKMSNQ
jgi:glycosyltransferase involved in cell wall biosynthesis